MARTHRSWSSRLLGLVVVGVSVVAVSVALADAPIVQATTLQATLLTPVDGSVSSNPLEPHHTPYDGDFSFDVATGGQKRAVYARFRNANASMSLTVAGISKACASGVFAHGGDKIVLNVLFNGVKVGTVAYSHLTSFPYSTVGQTVPVGARIGDNVTAADGVAKHVYINASGQSTYCWGGPHVHVEPRNDSKYACFFPVGLGTAVGAGSPLGIVGGEFAAAKNQQCPANAEYAPSTPTEGSFVNATDNGEVYRIVGGAPVYVSSWNSFGGPQPTIPQTRAQINSMPQYPANGTLVNAAGYVYRFAGGAPLYVSSWDAIGGSQPSLQIDSAALDQAGNASSPWNHVRRYPADGTFVSGAGTVYRFAGGAPIAVSTWNVYGGVQPTTFVDAAALTNAGGAGVWRFVRYTPADGTFVYRPEGAVFRIAGGAPIYVSSWAAVGGQQPAVLIDGVAIDRSGQSGVWSHLRLHPLEGTTLRGGPTGNYYRVSAAGAPIPTPAASPYTVVDPAAIANAGGVAPWNHLAAVPVASFVLSGVEVSGASVVGEVIRISYTVTNEGSATGRVLPGVERVPESATASTSCDGVGYVDPATYGVVLAPGESFTCVYEAELFEAGSVSFVASVSEVALGAVVELIESDIFSGEPPLVVVEVTDPPVSSGPVWPDFDGDGVADRGVFRPEVGGWFVDGQATGFLGLPGDVPVPADYDGDGVTDRAVFRDGAWFVKGQATRFLGQASDLPVPGDYDGDGAVEAAVFREGAWFVEGQATQYLGSPGDVPVPGDYDGDGVTEIGVFRPSVGGWYVDGETTVFYGLATDVPVPADYDGDGTTDRAVFRPEYGGWYVDGLTTEFIGLSSDVPVPADYDGDGIVERGVFRPEFGGWYVQDEATVFHGLGTDTPLSLPAAVYTTYFGQGGESALAVSG